MQTVSLSVERAAPNEIVRNGLVRLLGWRGLLFQSDPPTWDRWYWVRKHLATAADDVFVRTLDAGCGSGGFTLCAAAQGHHVLGLSFDDDANAMAERRAAILGLPHARFRTADLRRLDRLTAELGHFDQILCLETIEHLKDDEKLIRDLAGLLRPGGTLLLTTPTGEHRRLVGETLSATEDGGHVRWGYSLERLHELFRQAGLRPASEAFISGLISQQITNAARILAKLVGVRAAWAMTAPLRLLRILDRLLTRLVGYPWLSVAIVGVRE